MVLLSAGVLSFMIACAIWAASQIPAGAFVPVHWNASGRPNGWADRNGAIPYLFLQPAITLVLTALLAVIPSIEPRRHNLVRSRQAYMATWAALLALMAVIQVVLSLSIAGHNAPWVPNAIVAAIGGLFVVIGNYLGKLRSNYFVGIRTPWTLSSELSWNRTHRLGGRIMVLVGLATIFTAPLISVALAVSVGGSLLLVVFLFVYSYRIWARDPAKHPIGRRPDA
jgi:uncharacterized membrane protein